MIIWINGAFGSGKTHAAYELNRRLKDAFVFDPEEAGFYMQSNMPNSILKSDFQDYQLWRRFNFDMLDYIAGNYNGIVIVPMTVTDEIYYDEIIGKMKSLHQVCHLTLYANEKTLRKRLKRRGDKKNDWSVEQVGRCIKAFGNEKFGPYIYTDEMSIDAVVEAIGQTCGLELLTDERSFVRKKIDRFQIWLHHIRLIK